MIALAALNARAAPSPANGQRLARIMVSTAKSGTKLKSELAKLVQQEQQSYVDELVELMGKGFVVRTQVQIFQRHRQQDQNRQSQE